MYWMWCLCHCLSCRKQCSCCRETQKYVNHEICTGCVLTVIIRQTTTFEGDNETKDAISGIGDSLSTFGEMEQASANPQDRVPTCNVSAL